MCGSAISPVGPRYWSFSSEGVGMGRTMLDVSNRRLYTPVDWRAPSDRSLVLQGLAAIEGLSPDRCHEFQYVLAPLRVAILVQAEQPGVMGPVMVRASTGGSRSWRVCLPRQGQGVRSRKLAWPEPSSPRFWDPTWNRQIRSPGSVPDHRLPVLHWSGAPPVAAMASLADQRSTRAAEVHALRPPHVHAAVETPR